LLTADNPGALQIKEKKQDQEVKMTAIKVFVIFQAVLCESLCILIDLFFISCGLLYIL
jgi:hypothetical protein